MMMDVIKKMIRMPSCRIRICIGDDAIEEIFFTQPIADRIAYLIYSKIGCEIIDVHC
jgi:hypothetical protein